MFTLDNQHLEDLYIILCHMWGDISLRGIYCRLRGSFCILKAPLCHLRISKCPSSRDFPCIFSYLVEEIYTLEFFRLLLDYHVNILVGETLLEILVFLLHGHHLAYWLSCGHFLLEILSWRSIWRFDVERYGQGMTLVVL